MANIQNQSITASFFPDAVFNDLSQFILDYKGTTQVNKIVDAIPQQDTIAFIDEFLDRLNIKVIIDDAELKKIPTKGAFIMVANHPFGILDGMLALKIMKSVRPDFKLVDESIIKKMDALKDDVIAMHPIEKELGIPLSFGGSNEIFNALENEQPIGFFPAGEISSYQIESRKIEDTIWNNQVMKIISVAEVPVIPLYFEGNNSLLFHFIGMMFSGLKHAKLPSEILNKKDSFIKVRIGSPVPQKQIRQFETSSKLSRFLRAKTYGLANTVKVKKFYLPVLKKKLDIQQDINAPIAKEVIVAEIENLKLNGNLLLSQQNFDVFIADVKDIPNAINEIGRLREITFREVGEGTGLKLDLDEYDLYYKQLILWDNEQQKIAGGYRIGMGDYIIEHYGLKGFYTRSLFKMDKQLLPIFRQSAELGRSYIPREYQQKRLPLFLLWRGILAFLMRNQQCRYLFGPVSISNKYSNISKNLIIEFIKKNHFDESIAQFVKPRKKFKAEIKNLDIDILVESAADDIKLIDKYIQDFDPEMNGVPVLLKKYLNQNAKIVGFNIDPKFSDALDGLMFLDLKEVPLDTLDGLK